ncbi:hypothetical protein, partial [Salmonella sp. s51944]|uniref:hypothetical protein n=1 Tax=Salmonella sp. s51944 TaxID=3159655 RepID=UPI00398077C4
DIDTLFKFIRGLRVDELDFSFNSIVDVIGTVDAYLGIDYTTLNLSNNEFTFFSIINHTQFPYSDKVDH